MIIALDAGGTNLKAALVEPNGRILDRSMIRLPSESDGPKDRIVSRLAESLSLLMGTAHTGGHTVCGMAFAFPGPFDYTNGRCLMQHKYASVYGLPLLSEISRYIDLPHVTLLFCHDIHAFAYGEYRAIVGTDGEPEDEDESPTRPRVNSPRNLFCVSIGTGVGTGWIRDGRIVAGDGGGPRWSIYRNPWRGGMLGDLVSARGIVQRYRELAGLNEPVQAFGAARRTSSALDPREVARRAEQRDAAAFVVYREVGVALGETLRPILIEIVANILVFGGQISRSFRFFEPALSDRLQTVPSLTEIRAAVDPDLSVLRGAAGLLQEMSGSKS